MDRCGTSSRRRLLGFAAAALFTHAGAACILLAPPPAPSGPSGAASAAPSPACAAERAAAGALVGKGRLEQARLTLDAAAKRCPEAAPDAWALTLPLLLDLGRYEDAVLLAERVMASPRATPELRRAAADAKARAEAARGSMPPQAKAAMRATLDEARRARAAGAQDKARALFLRAHDEYHPNGPALAGAGAAAAAMGDSVEAARLFSRALADFDREGERLTVDVPDGRCAGGDLVARSPDGARIALAGCPAVSVRRTGALELEEELYLEGHTAAVTAIAFSPDGERLASGAKDRTAWIWDLADGRRLAVFPGHDVLVTALAFSPDGKRLATADRTKVRLWDIATSKLLVDVKAGDQVGALRFSPDGAVLTGLTLERGVRFWSVPDGKLLGPANQASLDLAAYAFTPDGAAFAVAGPAGHTRNNAKEGLQVWDVSSMTIRGSVVEPIVVGPREDVAVALAPHGATVAAAIAGHGARRWSVGPWRLEADLPKGSKELEEVQRGWATGGAWRAPVRVPRRTTWFHDVAFSRRGARLGMITEGAVVLWDLAADSPSPRVIPVDASKLALSPDGGLAAASSKGVVRLFDARTGAAAGEIAATGPEAPPIAFSPDGAWLAVAPPGDIQIYDPATQKLRRAFDAGGRLMRIVFSPDGKLVAGLAPSDADPRVVQGEARVFDVATGAQRPSLKGAPVWVGAGLAFSPDGAVLAAGSERAGVRLWDVATGAERTPPRAGGAAMDVAFSPDGRALASVTCALGEAESPPQLWDARTGVAADRLPGEGVESCDIAFVPAEGGGPPVLSVLTLTGTLSFLRVPTGARLGRLNLVNGGKGAIFHAPSGETELLGQADGARDLPRCRAGAASFPFALCDQRYETKGLLTRVVRGGR